MKQRLTALILLCLCLSSCGAAPEEKDAAPPDPAASLLETASGIPESEILLTVDGREVPAWKYLYWLAYTCDRLAQQCAEAQLPLDWSAPAGGGTLADYAKDQALADARLYAVVDNWSEAYGALPSESGGEGPELPALGLTQEQMDQLADTGRRYAALWALCRSGESALSPETQELESYAREAGALTLDRILVPIGEDRGAAQDKASALFAELNTAEDPAAVFSRLAAEGADPAGPRTLLPGDETLDASILSAAQSLEEGQCSGVLESPEGFSILRRLPLDPQPLLSAWFDSALERAAQSAQTRLSETCSALDAAAFYDALQQARQGDLQKSRESGQGSL